VIALLLKDLRVYFVSPLAYVVLALFLFLTGFAFVAQLSSLAPGSLPEASMRGMTYFIAVVLLFLSPILTMRSFADETRLKTMELIWTAPLSDTKLVLAKFFAAWLFFLILLLATLEFPIIMMLFGDPDKLPLLSNYIGLILLAGAFVAVGIFTSSLVSSPVLAALLSFVLLLLLWFLGSFEQAWAEDLSIIRHLETFSVGVLTLSDVAYYLLFMAGFLFLTVRFQEARRWK
jgi:ABC-2 type transport system permease protein